MVRRPWIQIPCWRVPADGFDLDRRHDFQSLRSVLGFDLVNGERERGTLRLVLSNQVRRSTLLAAKWAGGMLVLVVAFVTSIVAAGGVLFLEWAPTGAARLRLSSARLRRLH